MVAGVRALGVRDGLEEPRDVGVALGLAPPRRTRGTSATPGSRRRARRRCSRAVMAPSFSGLGGCVHEGVCHVVALPPCRGRPRCGHPRSDDGVRTAPMRISGRTAPGKARCRRRQAARRCGRARRSAGTSRCSTAWSCRGLTWSNERVVQARVGLAARELRRGRPVARRAIGLARLRRRRWRAARRWPDRRRRRTAPRCPAARSTA